MRGKCALLLLFIQLKGWLLQWRRQFRSCRHWESQGISMVVVAVVPRVTVTVARSVLPVSR